VSAGLPEGRATHPPERLPRPGGGEMFDRIAPRYDLLNRLMSLGLDQRWRRAAVEALAPRPGGRVLDLATGTADMAILAARRWPGIEVDALDPSREMLLRGRRKVARRGLDERVRLSVGDAARLPFANGAFDATMIAFGIRNVSDRAGALCEMSRVTRATGRVVILELTEPRDGLVSPLSRFYVHHVVPTLGALLSGDREYRYLQRSIESFPAPSEFAALMSGAGLGTIEVRPLSFGACHLFVGRPG